MKGAKVEKRNGLVAASSLALTLTLTLTLTMAGVAQSASAQATIGSYPAMAPRNQYMMEKTAEITLARTAAPAALSNGASVLVLGAHGFETAVKGANPFTCLVERSWDKPFDDPEFWNQKMRGPICMNEAAVRTVLPMIMERAEWALSGVSKEQMADRSKTSAKANTPPAAGAMSYMLSKHQYLSDDHGHPWYPHVMIFSPTTDGSAWGADVKGSPVLSGSLTSQITLFFIPVRKWSDGTLADYGPTPAGSGDHHHHH
jgi:hypothetical protein